MTGASRSAATTIAMAGRWAQTGLEQGRAGPAGPCAARRRAVVGRSGRSRRRRCSSSASSSGSTGAGRGREGGRQLEGARDAVAEVVPRHRRPGRSRRCRAGPGRPRRARPGCRSPGWPRRPPVPTSIGMNRATVHRIELGDDDGRQGEPRASHDATDPQALAERSERPKDGGQVGVQRTVDDETRVGGDHDGCGRRHRRFGQVGRDGIRIESASGLGTADGPRRRRQRRVGETNWTESRGRRPTGRTRR